MNEARLHMERIKRSFDRIQSQGADDQAYDDLMHFFEDCWHLKDHALFCLPNDQQQQMKEDIKNFKQLKIVADIANKSKHVILTRTKYVDAAVTHKYIHARDGADSRPATAKYTITIEDGSTYDAHNIAQEAIAAWQTILTKYKL